MGTQKKSFLQRISPTNYSFGTKLNIVVFFLVIISLIFANAISFWLIKKYIIDINVGNLERALVQKKEVFEDRYNNLLDIIADIPDESLGADVSEIKNNYNSYVDDLSFSSSSWNDSLKLYNLSISDYYTSGFIDKINYQKPMLEMIEPTEIVTKALQYYYLVKNPWPFEENFNLKDAGDNTSYSSKHKQIQKKIQSLVYKYNFNNVYLIESEKGNVVYSYKKNIAFGQNIFSNYLKQTDLAIAFQKAIIAKPGKVVSLDYNYFLPEYNKPAAFFSVPVLYNGKKNAVMVVELAPDYFTNLFIDKNEDQQSSEIISFNIVGNDRRLRNNPPEEHKNNDEFEKMLSRLNNKENITSKIGSGALTLAFDENLIPGKKDTYTGMDYLEQESFISSIPINVPGLNWYLVASSNYDKAFSYFNKVTFVSIIDFILLAIISIIVAYIFRLSITKRLEKLKGSMKKLVRGEHTEKVITIWNDEINELLESFNELSERIDNASEFALQLSEGDYNKEFKAISESDKFALALNTLKKALEDNKIAIDKREQEDKIRNWINEGIAKFNDLLRQSNNDINNLAYIIIENLIDYINASIGGVFLVESSNESDVHINLIASYAYDRRKLITKRIEIGEGLIGNCFLEKKPIYLKKIPQDYMEIGSGLGKTPPNVLYIVPLLYDQEVLGFLEIASFEELKKHEIEFIDKLSENIAATFSSVKLNTKTAELLEESKHRANEIAQQEEEMRQNLEEMQATQEELARLRDEDEQKTMGLQNDITKTRILVQEVVNNMTGEVYVKDASGVIILANEEIASRFNTTPQKLVGKTDNDIFTTERAEKEHELDDLVLNEGLYSGEIMELIGTIEQKYFIVKKQFRLPITDETGVITIRNKR